MINYNFLKSKTVSTEIIRAKSSVLYKSILKAGRLTFWYLQKIINMNTYSIPNFLFLRWGQNNIVEVVEHTILLYFSKQVPVFICKKKKFIFCNLVLVCLSNHLPNLPMNLTIKTRNISAYIPVQYDIHYNCSHYSEINLKIIKVIRGR